VYQIREQLVLSQHKCSEKEVLIKLFVEKLTLTVVIIILPVCMAVC